MGTRHEFGREAQDLGKEVQKLGTRCEIWGQGAIVGHIFGHEARIWARGTIFGQGGAKIGHKVRDLDTYLGTRRKFGREAQYMGKEAQKLGTRCEIWGQGAIFGHEAQDLRKRA